MFILATYITYRQDNKNNLSNSYLLLLLRFDIREGSNKDTFAISTVLMLPMSQKTVQIF